MRMRNLFSALALMSNGALAHWLDSAASFEVPKMVRLASQHPTNYSPIAYLARADNGSQTNSTNRTTCAAEPNGYGPVPITDTAEGWMNLTSMAEAAKAAPVPGGFSRPENGTALNAAVKAVGFEGFTYLQSYDVNQCASICLKRRECISFNISCPNPNSTTTIKCVFWGNELDASLATNYGEIREQFNVLIAGSNIYTKLNPGANLTSFGFAGPRTPRVKAIFEPPFEPTNNINTTLNFQTYPYRLGFYYNPEVCARACNERTKADSKDTAADPYTEGAYAKCNMFTSFELFRDGAPHAMVCVQYSSVWDSIYASWTGETAPSGQVYSPKLVEVYARADYSFPPICADETRCGQRYYAGGDCSGWGEGFCGKAQGQE